MSALRLVAESELHWYPRSQPCHDEHNDIVADWNISALTPCCATTICYKVCPELTTARGSMSVNELMSWWRPPRPHSSKCNGRTAGNDSETCLTMLARYVQTTAAGGVSWEVVEEKAAAAPKEKKKKKQMTVKVPKWCGKWVVGMDDFKEGVVGAKSKNIAGSATNHCKTCHVRIALMTARASIAVHAWLR